MDENTEDLVIKFNIHYKNGTKIIVMDEGENIYLKKIRQNFIDERVSTNFFMSQFRDVFCWNSITSTIIPMVIELVPRIWKDDIVEQLKTIVSIVGLELTGIYHNSYNPSLVNIIIKTVTIIKPDEDSDTRVSDYFEEYLGDCKEYAIENGELIYERPTIYFSSLTPTDEFEDDDCCIICRKDFCDSNQDLTQSIWSDSYGIWMNMLNKYQQFCSSNDVFVRCHGSSPEERRFVVGKGGHDLLGRVERSKIGAYLKGAQPDPDMLADNARLQGEEYVMGRNGRPKCTRSKTRHQGLHHVGSGVDRDQAKAKTKSR
ncbi:hypothetical protein SAY87_025161 [Trapa incisa]|uniref:Uncharacterized protein n=1 Tax=Trapa incisa TaxID=236973 RepID=A0AAN7GL19_9MYRT|nr:hypothetical protein SAY87_025161 [Trapa incisa]